MRTLTVNELHAVQGGDYSDWQVIILASLSSATALGSFHAIKTTSLAQGLQVAGSCGLLTFLAAIGFISIFGLLPLEIEPSCLVAE